MKKAFLFLIIIIFIASQSNAGKQGQEKIDSLFSVLKTAKEDTSKVKILIDLSFELSRNKPDTAIYFANAALALASKLKYELGIAHAYNALGHGFMNLGKYKEALKNFNDVLTLCDELLASATTAYKLKILKPKGDAYNGVGIVNFSQGDYHEGLKNYFAALKIYEELGDIPMLSENAKN